MRKCLIIRYIPKYLKVIECNISGSVLGTIRSKVDTTVSALIFFLPPSRSLPVCKIQEQMQYYKNARLTVFCLSCLFEI